MLTGFGETRVSLFGTAGAYGTVIDPSTLLEEVLSHTFI